MALPISSRKLTEEEYFALERQGEIKHEFVDGEVYAMAGASENYNLICAYLIAGLIGQLGDKPCRVYPSDMRLKVEATGLIAYPDVSIVCGTPLFRDDTSDTLLNPLIVVEVLSPSSERFDRGRKLQDYRRIPSLQEYLIISQDQPRIERFLRQDEVMWLYSDVVGLDAHIAFPSIGCMLPLAEIYRKVDFSR